MCENMREEADLKLILLIYIKKIWVLAVGAGLGALIAGLIYFLCHVVYAPAREYESTSKLYLTFAAEDDGDAYQYYNGYTWNDLLKTELILDDIMDKLPGEDREQVKTEIFGDILSDIRVLTIVVTTNNPERTEKICHSVEETLVEFASKQVEFDKIEVIDHGKAELVVVEDETVRAVWIGAVLGLILSAFILALWIISNDAVYVPGDIRRRFPELAFAGVFDKQGNKIEMQGVTALWDDNRDKIISGYGSDAILSIPFGKSYKKIADEYIASGDIKGFEIIKAQPSFIKAYFGKYR